MNLVKRRNGVTAGARKDHSAAVPFDLFEGVKAGAQRRDTRICILRQFKNNLTTFLLSHFVPKYTKIKFEKKMKFYPYFCRSGSEN
jgi:hypothetical protein